MRNRILGGIGVLWGGVLTLRWLFASTPAAAPVSAYASGQIAGIVFGVLLLVVGAYYLLRGPEK